MRNGISDKKQQRIEDKIRELREKQVSEAVENIIEFDKTPSDLKDEMDRFVIGQNKGKKIIATAIAFHYRRLGKALKQSMAENDGDVDTALRNTRTPKANILVIGPTGCGKTYTSETASDLVGVPFIAEDLTRFSEVGYVGQNTNDILVDLLLIAGGNPHVAQMGMVYLDEIDKIATEAVVLKDVSGKGVQKGLLKLVEGMENTVDIGRESVILSTKHVLFIAGGAYEGLDDIVQKRMADNEYDGDWQDYLMPDDLVAFGMERQLVGRFPVKVIYDQLSDLDLKNIMIKSEDSPLKAFANDLQAWDIDLTFTDEALTEVARRAEREGIGARGLTSILHRILIDDMYNLPGTYAGALVVDEHYIKERLR
ncbi:MAG: AAA family ATPase [Deltaproteobacteria bacterium]|nr:AAA family ATPase [Deltaproteobacteria bacterium]